MGPVRLVMLGLIGHVTKTQLEAFGRSNCNHWNVDWFNEISNVCFLLGFDAENLR